MIKFSKAFSLIAALLLFAAGCGTQTFLLQREQQSAQEVVSYEEVLGKSRADKAVTEFIVDNQCSSADAFQLCKDVGMALWVDSKQIVKTVYLYSGGTEGIKRYRGKLPFGVTFYDPMWRVQEKLRNPDVNDSLAQAGLPDEARSPDHMHYWAVYKRIGMTIIYDSPSADEDAYIYAILLST